MVLQSRSISKLKRLLLIPVSMLYLFALGGELRAQTDDQKLTAHAFIDAVIAQQWERVEAMEHPRMREQIDREKWGALMTGLESKAGKILSHHFQSAEMNGNYASIVHNVYFEKDSVGFRVVIDSMNLVGGFWLDVIEKDFRFEAPSYADTSVFNEVDVVVGDSLKLSGVLSVPVGDGPFPAVILIHGSGPQDMDETIGGNKPFRDIAWGLASKGVMVLRYNKRTKQHGARMNLYKTGVREEVIDDAIAAVRLLRTHRKTDTAALVLLGHSLGATLAPGIAYGEPSIKALVMLAPIARTLEVVVADQLRFIASQQDSLTAIETVKLNNELKKAAKIEREELNEKMTLMGAPASYYYDLHKRDARSYAAGIDIPMFLARGDKDYQAPEIDFELWKKALAGRDNVKFQTYKNCFHIFIETDAKPGPWNYEMQGNVTAVLIDDMADWILKSIPKK